jgi:segregation and condensation protein B
LKRGGVFLEPNGEHRSVKDLVENLLFLANEPISLKRLAEALPHSKEEIAAAIDSLTVEYMDRGLKVRFVSGGYMFSTDPALASEIEQFYNLQRIKRLSQQALETLAVIAYNQPITRAEIEAVRGVGTTGTIQTLTERGLIKVVGQKETLGNPFLYGTTDEFLNHFGLGDISELPQLEFEVEGLTRPLKDREGAEKAEGKEEAEVTPVDFGLTEESAEVTINVQQKGA